MASANDVVPSQEVSAGGVELAICAGACQRRVEKERRWFSWPVGKGRRGAWVFSSKIWFCGHFSKAQWYVGILPKPTGLLDKIAKILREREEENVIEKEDGGRKCTIK